MRNLKLFAIAGVLAGIAVVVYTAARFGTEATVVVTVLVLLSALMGVSYVIVRALNELRTTIRGLHARLGEHATKAAAMQEDVHAVAATTEALRRTYLKNATTVREALGASASHLKKSTHQNDAALEALRQSVTSSLGVLGRQQNSLAERMRSLEQVASDTSNSSVAEAEKVQDALNQLASGTTDLSVRANVLLGLLRVRNAETPTGVDQ